MFELVDDIFGAFKFNSLSFLLNSICILLSIAFPFLLLLIKEFVEKDANWIVHIGSWIVHIAGVKLLRL